MYCNNIYIHIWMKKTIKGILNTAAPVCDLCPWCTLFSYLHIKEQNNIIILFLVNSIQTQIEESILFLKSSCDYNLKTMKKFLFISWPNSCCVKCLILKLLFRNNFSVISLNSESKPYPSADRHLKFNFVMYT